MGKSERGSLYARTPLVFDHVPDHRGHVRAVKILDGADSGRGGDIDLGEEAVDHVDADKDQSAFAQGRADPGADVAFALGEAGLLRSAAPHHVGAQIVCRWQDRKSTRLNSSHLVISYAVF